MEVFWFVIGVITGGSASIIAVAMLFHRIAVAEDGSQALSEGEQQ